MMSDNDIINLEREVADLRKLLDLKEEELSNLKRKLSTKSECPVINNKLPRWAIERYSRQILLPDIGVYGQLKLCKAKVLIVGAGGLGCPAASYLAGAGVGEIGIIDYDTVDVTNVHRQLLHSEDNQGVSKVESAVRALNRINSKIKLHKFDMQLNSETAEQVLVKFDIVLDCSDNVPTRYLLNDACVLLNKPLISGSALKLEGQLTIYNYKDNDNNKELNGPCYRCIFPTPPPPETVGSCSANGVCGPVAGLIGTLQALEAIKVICGFSRDKVMVGRMLIFDGSDFDSRIVKLRNKKLDCAVCSENPSIKKLIDYEQFCRTKAVEKDPKLKILLPESRITPLELKNKLQHSRHLLIDVRNENEFQMCNIDGSVNVPLVNDCKMTVDRILKISEGYNEVTFICRRGNDSQIVADEFKKNTTIPVNDVEGGLHAWSKSVDKEFPIY